MESLRKRNVLVVAVEEEFRVCRINLDMKTEIRKFFSKEWAATRWNPTLFIAFMNNIIKEISRKTK